MLEHNTDHCIPAATEEEVIQDETFTYAGYQVVRGEFFAHIHEPSITFNNCKISANTACVNKLPATDFVQIMVNSEEKKLVIRPCEEDEKDSFRWCGLNKKNGRKRPKHITCRIFFAKIVHLMQWNPDHRYKLLGKLIQSNGEYLFVFDMKAAEIYQRVQQDGEKPKSSRTPVFPSEWKNQFGLPFEEHRKSLQVNIFNGYTVFGINSPSQVRDENLQNYAAGESEDVLHE